MSHDDDDPDDSSDAVGGTRQEESRPEGRDAGVPPEPVAWESEIDWNHCIRFLLAFFRQKRGLPNAEIEVLKSESLLGLIRSIRRERPRNLEALMTRIAQCDWLDYVRRRYTQARNEPINLLAEDIAALPPAQDRDGLDLHEFKVFARRQWFALRKPIPCSAIAMAVDVLGKTLKQYALETRQSYDKVRQDWSRCKRAFEAALQAGTVSLDRDELAP